MSEIATQLNVSIPCGTCAATIRLGEDRCSNCGRAATADEIAALQRRWEASDPEAARRANQIHLGRAIFAVIAVSSTLWGLVLWGVIDLEAASFQLVVAVVLGALFATSFRWALISTMSAAVIYLGAWIIQFLLNPAMGASFVVGKGVTLAGLVAGCIAEIRMRRAKRALMPTRPPSMAG